MDLQVEKLEDGKAKLTITVPAEDVEKALQRAYISQRASLNLPGFRKGKAPRDMIEKMYGPQVFYNEAADKMMQESYQEVMEDEDLGVVSPPKISVVQMAKGKDFIYTAEVVLRPEVTLGEYKGLKVNKYTTDVTFMEINTEMENERAKNAREIDVTDRGVQDKDEITLDFEGFIDGKAFDGGKAKDYKLTVGSASFIPGFEDQLIGAKIGEETEVNVTFPEEYQQKDLAGKPAVFKCTVKSIKVKELPELNDEFAAEVSAFDTIEEYRKDVEKKLKERKENDGKQNQKSQAVAKAVENATVNIPAEMIDLQVKQMEDDFARSMVRQGLSIDDYLKETGVTLERLSADLRPEAEKYIKTRLVLDAVVKAEKIEVPEERINEELEKMAMANRVDIKDLKGYMGEKEMQNMKTNLAIEAAIALISLSAVEE